MNTILAISVRTENRILAARQAVRNRLDADRGAALAEYGLLLGLVALVAIAAIAAFGDELVEVFQDAETRLDERDPAEG